MSNNLKNKAMATLYREPLTAEEILRHQNNYENETPAVFVGTWSKYNEGRALAGYQKQYVIKRTRINKLSHRGFLRDNL